MSWNRIPVWARFSAPVQTGPEAHPASYSMGTGSISGVKQPGRGVDHPPPSGAEVKERVEVYLCSPSCPSWRVLGWSLPLPFILLLLLFIGCRSTAVWTWSSSSHAVRQPRLARHFPTLLLWWSRKAIKWPLWQALELQTLSYFLHGLLLLSSPGYWLWSPWVETVLD